MRVLLTALRYTVSFFRQIAYVLSVVVSLAISLFALYIVLMFGLHRGLHIAALLWSFFVLCVPYGSSGILLSPFRRATRLKLQYADIVLWIVAVCLNIYTYSFSRPIYLKSISTHLLYQIIANPWPYWLIIAVCILGMIYRLFIAADIMRRSFVLHYLLNGFLVAAGFATLGLLTYQELIIIMNVQGR